MDEIASASPAEVAENFAQIAERLFESIGTVVEYELHRLCHRSDLPRLVGHSPSPLVHRIDRLILGEPETRSSQLQPVVGDATRIPTRLGADTGWTAFLKRAELTARRLGITEQIAAGLAGAIQELADNVVRHSEATQARIAAFAQVPGGFEYVVADTGIGVLASLRKAAEFRSLTDELEALPLAVTAGVSSRGRDTGNGFGYRAVFSPLKALSGQVRLRSGRAVLEVSGIGPKPDQGRCSQRPLYQGLIVTTKILIENRV